MAAKRELTIGEEMKQLNSRLKDNSVFDIQVSHNSIDFFAVAEGKASDVKGGTSKIKQKRLPIYIGNLKNINVPAENQGDGYILVPVFKKHPDGKKEGKREYFKIDDDKLKMLSFTSIFVLTKRIDGNVKAGDILWVRDISVKEVIVEVESPENPKEKVKEKRIYISANFIQVCKGYRVIDFIRTIKRARMENSVFRKYEIENDKSDYGGDVVNFINLDYKLFSELEKETNRALIPMNKEGYRHNHKIFTTLDGFTVKMEDTNKLIRILNCDSRPTVQYHPNKDTVKGEWKRDVIMIKATFWEDRLDCFLIKNEEAWAKLGPMIVQKSEMIGIMNLNKKRTLDNVANAEEATNVGADFCLFYYGTAILFDPVYTYQNIGISVTTSFTETYLPKFKRPVKDDQNESLENVTIICLNETQYEFNSLLKRLDSEFEIRVIFRSIFDNNELEILNKTDPELTSEILESAILQQRKNEQKWRSKIDRESPLFDIDIRLEPDPIIYFFLIIKGKEFKQTVDYPSRFIDGFPSKNATPAKIDSKAKMSTEQMKNDMAPFQEKEMEQILMSEGEDDFTDKSEKHEEGDRETNSGVKVTDIMEDFGLVAPKAAEKKRKRNESDSTSQKRKKT